MYETPKRTLFTSGDVKKKQKKKTEAQRRRETPTWLQESLLTRKTKPNSPWRTDKSQTPACFAQISCKKLKFLVLASVSRCGRRQVVFSSEYVDGKGGAERRQVGWSVKASDWCALSYVGINHDSEMTYFLTPQTNSTFNRSQRLCQTAFCPCSLSKSCI